jgi:hypothetical protein
MKKKSALIDGMLVASVVGAIAAACGADKQETKVVDHVSSRSYSGHANDADVHALVNAYPAAVGTRLDDCQTCHRGGTFTYDNNGKTSTTTKASCDYCHLVLHPQDSYIEPQPKSFTDTLNPFGLAYLRAGRDANALSQIASADSDGDGFANGDEIADQKYPGDANSKPGQTAAPQRIVSLAELRGMRSHEQFQLANSHKQQFDDYATYRGVRVVDLLDTLGIDRTSAEFQGVSVIAPDGYVKDFSADEVNQQYPKGLFYAGLDTATLGTECGFVTYPQVMPEGLVDGAEISGIPWLLLAYDRDGVALDSANLDITSGKINGNGPLRIVVPQSIPGAPDRGSSFSPTSCDDGRDYDDAKDHNAGAMVRGVIAVRVNPMPAGLEEFDYQNGGWAYIDDPSVIVYGFGVAAD